MKILLTILALCLAAAFVRSATTIKNRDGEGIAQTLEGRVSAEQLRAANGFPAVLTAPDLDIIRSAKIPDALVPATTTTSVTPTLSILSGEVLIEIPAGNHTRAYGTIIVRVNDEEWAEVTAAFPAGVESKVVIHGPPGYKRAKK